jgi:hypothetical protein
MPQPTQGDVHVNTPLTNISIAYMQDAMNFVADRIFPNVPVAKQSDRYYVYDRGFFNRDEMEVRAPGTESAGSGYEVDNTPTYYAPVYAFHHDIPDQVRSNADSQVGPGSRRHKPGNPQGASSSVRSSGSPSFFTSSVWTTDIDGVAGSPSAGETIQWNDASSDPIADVRLGVRTVLELTGFKPNTLVLGKAVFDALIDHPDVVDRIKYGQSQGNVAMADTAELAALLKIRACS